METKPWDKLRKPEKKPPIERGEWRTSLMGALVSLNGMRDESCILSLGGLGSPARQSLRPTDLRELSEFCLELAAQLEGK